MDGLLGSQIMELYAEDELEVGRLFAAASIHFEQAYNSRVFVLGGLANVKVGGAAGRFSHR